jgi:hypothetical protein
LSIIGPDVAILWSDTAASWVNLNPVGAQRSMAWDVFNGRQVGWVELGVIRRASLWTGSAASWVNLHSFLPPAQFSESAAYGVWDDGIYVYVVGYGTNSSTGQTEALMWKSPIPCYANCDRSTAPPVLNVNDFTCFLNAFAAGLPYANCDGRCAAPTYSVTDFQCFMDLYAAGCP